MIINDGTGSGNQAEVDASNRLRVRSVSISEQVHRTELGNSYNLNTGEITLTSANESAVMYFKNNESSPYIITAIAVGLGPSTGGAATAIPVIRITRNPTGGTIVDDASNVAINVNRNFSSTNSLSADVYKGDEGKTLSGDVDYLFVYQTPNSRLFAAIDTVVPKGASLGVTITPQTSNTSMKCYVALIGYLETEE